MMSRMMSNDSICLSGTTPGIVEVGGGDGAGVIIKCIFTYPICEVGERHWVFLSLWILYIVLLSVSMCSRYNGVQVSRADRQTQPKKQTMLLKYNRRDLVSKTNTVRDLPLMNTRCLSTGWTVRNSKITQSFIE